MNYELTDACLAIPRIKQEIEQLLTANGLQPEVPPVYVCVMDDEDHVVGGGGLDGNIIKCLAVRSELRDEALSNRIVGRLLEKAHEAGYSNVFAFTKPEYEHVFTSLSFHLVGRAPKAILLESNPRGISSYSQYLKTLCRPGRNGAIVMNCNPMTRGHLYLIEKAAQEVDNLYIIPVKTDSCSAFSSDDGKKISFSYEERVQIVREETQHLPNVIVCEGSDYAISRATFPTYFIKERSEQADTHIALDCNIFATHIVPALDLQVRFVGTEPTDEATAQYNRLMKRHIKIDVVQIPRLEDNGQPVSASAIRHLICEGQAAKVLELAAPSSIPYVLAKAAAQALSAELMLTPKPGLVQPGDSGAHADMTLATMQTSIAALYPYFVQLARLRLSHPVSTACLSDEVRRIGIEAEQAMLTATGGVNTHKGALFALGLTLTASVLCIRREGVILSQHLKKAIIALAKDFPTPQHTHGQCVRERYGIPGALDSAQAGYPLLFDQWLPFYKQLPDEDPAKSQLLLLYIMSTLEDTNVYHRGGPEAALWVKEQAQALLHNYSEMAMCDLCREFKRRNLSPGGAADMLSLTLFIYSITTI